MRRSRARRLRWLEGLTPNISESDVFGGVDIGTNANSVNGPALTVVTALQVADELDGNGTIMRVVGRLTLRNGSLLAGVGQPVAVWMGMKVVDLPSGAGSAPEYNLQDIDANDVSWMWTNFVICPPTIANNQSGTNQQILPFGDWVDVRSRRRIRKEQALVIYMQVAANADDQSLDINVVPYLRVLAKLN